VIEQYPKIISQEVPIITEHHKDYQKAEQPRSYEATTKTSDRNLVDEIVSMVSLANKRHINAMKERF
jgi:hypothetical protein